MGKKIEIFPLKVSSYLREEAEAGGFWWHLWTGVEECVLSVSVWDLLTLLPAFACLSGM